MLQDGINIDWNLWSNIVVIFTFLFILGTYIYDLIIKYRFKKHLRRVLEIELRTIYDYCRTTINEYDYYKNHCDNKLNYGIPGFNIESPICNYIINSEYFIKISYNTNFRIGLLNVSELIKLINSELKRNFTGTYAEKEKDRYTKNLFEKRIVPLRDKVLELSDLKKFFSMVTIQKHQIKYFKVLLKWYEKEKIAKRNQQKLVEQAKKFKKHFEKDILDEIEAINVIKEYRGEYCTVMPDYLEMDDLLYCVNEYLEKQAISDNNTSSNR